MIIHHLSSFCTADTKIHRAYWCRYCNKLGIFTSLLVIVFKRGADRGSCVCMGFNADRKSVAGRAGKLPKHNDNSLQSTSPTLGLG